MEHAELIEEMSHIEKMATHDRLALARKRRRQQLHFWIQKEREFKKGAKVQKSNKRSIFFNESVILLEAAARNDIDEVRRLLVKGVSPDSCNEDGLTALHQCCIDNNEALLLLLLEYNANVNAEDSEKWTPLHAAATCGHLRLVRLLISRGANLLAVNADGNMPYDICEDEGALDYIEGEMAKRGVTQTLIDDTRASTEKQMLVEMQRIAATNRANLEAYDSQGATPLHIASANGYLSVVEFLLEQKVRTDVRDKDDWQPSHAAACWGHLEVLELLAMAGADLDAKNKHDETPQDICEDAEIKERILELRTEQENKKQAEAKRKVRRSQSNTRTQSVRRTSLRDKGLTARRDAVEEARLRMQVENKGLDAPELPPTNNNKPVLKPSNFTTAAATNNNNNTIADATEPGALQVYENRRAPEGRDDDSTGGEMPPDGSKESLYTSTDGNGKVTVHVVVTINGNGTLADLKKQRMEIRNKSMDVTGLASPLAGDESAPGSPVITEVIRFTGETTEENVGYSKSKRCCIIM